MGMNFSFERQVNEPNQKEAVSLVQQLYASDGRELINVSENPEWFVRGVDLYEETKQRTWIDVKCDEKIHETGNVAIELIEVCSKNGFIKKGWLFNDIDYIFYVDWILGFLYPMRLNEIKRVAFSKTYKGFSAFHPEKEYFTLGILIPLIDIPHTTRQLKLI